MKPAQFEYFAPNSLNEALSLLDQYDFDAKILAGGQSLIPMMNMRLARPKVIIDINGLPDLNYINVVDDEIQIGGLTRQFEIEHSNILEEVCPLLTEGVKKIGYSQIRSRGTIGGSVAHADSVAELPVMLATLGGTITLVSSDGERSVSTDEFFLTYLTTTMEPNEIVASINIPIPNADRTGYAIEEFALRNGDFAIVLVAAMVTLNVKGEIESARLGLGGVDGAPLLMEEITGSLVGEIPTDELIEACCQRIEGLVNPEPDIHASAEYRRDLSVTLSTRALKRAVQSAVAKV